ncbi:Hypothetical Protein RradSPS_0514 [Rubrobacter radiotolerans]|uniref:YnhF family membrane protein n=1 Tax=Rubrobacter radiotolerans TaxID=42256 RepID=A0A023WZZ1_RUBRA|nr:Hypothetical Protein RradSPS_0514 [Rubrobacter radiotolerans]
MTRERLVQTFGVLLFLGTIAITILSFVAYLGH